MKAIADNAYFVQNAAFPGVGNTTSLNAPNTPWILYGGSLPGQQAAISLHVYGGDGGLLWGGFAGSGTTKAVLEYPQWYSLCFAQNGENANLLAGTTQFKSLDHRIV